MCLRVRFRVSISAGRAVGKKSSLPTARGEGWQHGFLFYLIFVLNIGYFNSHQKFPRRENARKREFYQVTNATDIAVKKNPRFEFSRQQRNWYEQDRQVGVDVVLRPMENCYSSNGSSTSASSSANIDSRGIQDN